MIIQSIPLGISPPFIKLSNTQHECDYCTSGATIGDLFGAYDSLNSRQNRKQSKIISARLQYKYKCQTLIAINHSQISEV